MNKFKLLRILSKTLWVLFILCMISIVAFLLIVPCVAAAFVNNPEPVYLFSGKMVGLSMLFGMLSGFGSCTISVCLA